MMGGRNIWKTLYLAFPSLCFFIFCLCNTASIQLVVNKVCWWLDSNLGSLVSEATALPTEPKPRPVINIFCVFFTPNLKTFLSCKSLSLNVDYFNVSHFEKTHFVKHLSFAFSRVSWSVWPALVKFSPLWRNNLVIFEPLFGVKQNFEPILARILCCWAIIHCCKWPNIEAVIYPSGHTGRDMVLSSFYSSLWISLVRNFHWMRKVGRSW